MARLLPLSLVSLLALVACNEAPGAAVIAIEPSGPTTLDPWEASNCFGQGLTGDRYLWVYVAK